MKPVGLPDPVPSAVVAVSGSCSLICPFIAIRADRFDQTVILVLGPERFCTGSPDRDTGLVSRSIISIAYSAGDPVFLIQDPFLAQAVI